MAKDRAIWRQLGSGDTGGYWSKYFAGCWEDQTNVSRCFHVDEAAAVGYENGDQLDRMSDSELDAVYEAILFVRVMGGPERR